jgi:hypothetical protein
MALGIAVGAKAATVGLIPLTHVAPARSPLFSGLRVRSMGHPSRSKASSSRSIRRESSCNTWHRVGTPGAPTTVTYLLERLDGGTRITLRHTGFTSPESCTSTSVSWETSFERLTEILATKRPARGTSSRLACGVLGSPPLVVGGLIVLMLPYLDDPIGKIGLLVVGGGLTGSIYVVCPVIIGEFTPVSQRASVIAIYGWRSGAGCKWQNGCVLEMPPRCSKLACGPQDHRTSQILRRAGRPAPATAGRRDGTAFAARPRKDRSVTEAKGPPWRARPPGCADVAGLEIYWRSYLTTRRTRPHSPGCTT